MNTLWNVITYQLVDCSSATRSCKNENIFIIGCIESFFQNCSGLFPQHASSERRNTSGSVRVPIKGQDFFGYDLLNIAKRFPRCYVVTVDNLAGAIRSFKNAVSSNNISVYVVCKLEWECTILKRVML